MSNPDLEAYSITFSGRVLNRGFWLYVIDVRSPQGRHLYVGRTGDSSSANAGSPFSRIGHHLDSRLNAKGNALARNLRRAGIELALSSMEMVAVGPLFPEEKEFSAHCAVRDQVAALERGLAASLRKQGYSVIGSHSARCEPDTEKLEAVLRVVTQRLAQNS